MKLALIGVGQAGGRLVDAFLGYDERAGTSVVRSAVAVNTARPDLEGLERLPAGDRLLIGESRVKGHGVGADNELASDIAREDLDEITEAFDSVPSDVDAFLVVAALGGGTGSGAGPVIVRRLQQLYSEPVYALGVLPASDEGGLYSLNAARSLQTFVRETDHLLVVDNDAWRDTGESVSAGFEAINAAVAQRFGVLFSAGEVDPAVEVAQSVVDASEVINTRGGGGVSSVGYATAEVDAEDGLLSRVTESDDPIVSGGDATNRITSLVRSATLGRLTLPCNVQSVERALVVVAGPPEHLDRKGIERGRKWLEEETGSMEVRGGDYPIPGAGSVAAAVLLAGVTDVPRIEALKARAVEADEAAAEATAGREAGMSDLMDDGLDPLF
jgi:cell division GTPase FtsZ